MEAIIVAFERWVLVWSEVIHYESDKNRSVQYARRFGQPNGFGALEGVGDPGRRRFCCGTLPRFVGVTNDESERANQA